MRRTLFPILILLLLSVFLDCYVFQGVKTLTDGLNDSLQFFIRFLFWLVSEVVLLTLVYQFITSFPSRNFKPFFNTAVNSFIILFVTKLVFMLVLLAEDIYRLVFSFARVLSEEGFAMPQRMFAFSFLALAISIIPFFAFLFGVTRGKYNYKVHSIKLAFDDLPEEFDGFKIVQISDIHSGSLDNQKEIQKGINLIMSQNPDLFVFTGDLVNNRSSEILPWIDAFAQIRAPYGQFSVLGNHDYGDYIPWTNPKEKKQNLVDLKSYHQEMGFRLLLDEHVRIRKGDSQIVLLGIENWGKGFGERGNLQKASAGIDPKAFKLLLSHDPSHWEAQVKNNPFKIQLTFSGHTHGMQFGIELFGFKWSPVKYRYKNWAGIAEENGRFLYVNRGFGFLGFSGRVGIWPEITVITLTRGS